eukprot:14503334-Alexandrium_andersonii.AAC.1
MFFGQAPKWPATCSDLGCSDRGPVLLDSWPRLQGDFRVFRAASSCLNPGKKRCSKRCCPLAVVRARVSS